MTTIEKDLTMMIRWTPISSAFGLKRSKSTKKNWQQILQRRYKPCAPKRTNKPKTNDVEV